MIGRWYRWRGQIWALLIRGEPFTGPGPSKNVLIENVWSGELVVRPFRGLRRVT